MLEHDSIIGNQQWLRPRDLFDSCGSDGRASNYPGGRDGWSVSELFVPLSAVLASNLTFAGNDLSGNTFWEFKDQINANRLRRIVQYSPQAHYADVKISRTHTSPASSP